MEHEPRERPQPPPFGAAARIGPTLAADAGRTRARASVVRGGVTGPAGPGVRHLQSPGAVEHAAAAMDFAGERAGPPGGGIGVVCVALSRLDALPTAIYGGEGPARGAAAVAEAVADAARAGDETARTMWTAAAGEPATTAPAAAERTPGAGVPADVSWAGGVFAAEDLLRTPFTRRLAARAPRLRVVPPAGTSLDGARFLAAPGREPDPSWADLGVGAARARMTLEPLRHGPIVSPQAPPGGPPRAPAHMAAMAQAALVGGARGIRAAGPADIATIARAVELPVIGLPKLEPPGTGVHLTSTLESARAVPATAVDGTLCACHDGAPADAFTHRLDRELGAPALPDVHTLETGRGARHAGAAAVATTLSASTGPHSPPDGPDLWLVADPAGREVAL